MAGIGLTSFTPDSVNRGSRDREFDRVRAHSFLTTRLHSPLLSNPLLSSILLYPLKNTRENKWENCFLFLKFALKNDVKCAWAVFEVYLNSVYFFSIGLNEKCWTLCFSRLKKPYEYSILCAFKYMYVYAVSFSFFSKFEILNIFSMHS